MRELNEKALLRMMGIVEGGRLPNDQTYELHPSTVRLLRGEFTVLEEYSGKGMQGYGCIAIVVSEDDGFEFAKQLQDLLNFVHTEGYLVEEEDLSILLRIKPFSDNMGLGRVYYWPDFVPEESDE